MLILAGAYTMEQNGPRFHRVGAPDPQDLAHLLKRLVRRIVRRLTRDGLLVEDPEQPWLDLEPSDTLDQLNAASIRYRIAVGQRAGGRTLTLKNPALARTDSTPKPFTANRDGFSLELLRLLPGPPARSARAIVPVHNPSCALPRAAINQCHRPSGHPKNHAATATIHPPRR